MAKPILDDELWEFIAPFLPPPNLRRFRYPGRKPLDDRQVLTGILFVLKTGIPWEDLPQEMDCGSGMTCWRRLRDWHEAGVWEDVHRALPDACLVPRHSDEGSTVRVRARECLQKILRRCDSGLGDGVVSAAPQDDRMMT